MSGAPTRNDMWSDSEDCNCSEGGSSIGNYLGGSGCPHYPQPVVAEPNNNFENISEHSSDVEETESEGDMKGINDPKIKKPKKKKEDGAAKDKKKKNKEP